VGRWMLMVRYRADRLVCCQALELLLSSLLTENTYRVYGQSKIDYDRHRRHCCHNLNPLCCDGGGRKEQTGGVRPSASHSRSAGLSLSPVFRQPFLSTYLCPFSVLSSL
jgi:hypothetical protein